MPSGHFDDTTLTVWGHVMFLVFYVGVFDPSRILLGGILSLYKTQLGGLENVARTRANKILGEIAVLRVKHLTKIIF